MKIHYDLTNLFFLTFVQHISRIEYDINECLLSSGHSGPLPIANLDEIFMKLSSYDGQTYVLEHTLVRSQGDVGLLPEELTGLTKSTGLLSTIIENEILHKIKYNKYCLCSTKA